jgi:hypothetical protein
MSSIVSGAARRHATSWVWGSALLLASASADAASPSVDGRWVEIGTPARVNALMGYDSRNDRVLLFSRVGHMAGVDEFDQWSLSFGSSRWAPLADAGDLPASGIAPVVLHDPARQRLLLVSHGGAFVYVHDFETATWSRIVATGTPGYSGHFAYDPVNERVFMFGGAFRCTPRQECYRNDVWVLPLAGSRAWTKLEIAGPRPLERTDATLMYDPDRTRLFLFGGYAGEYSGGFLGDFWELSLDGTPAWTRLDPLPNRPPVRFYPQIVHVPAERRFLLFDEFSSIWSLRVDAEGPPVWERLSVVGTSPSGSFGAAWTYDASRRRIVVRASDGGATWALPVEAPRRWAPLEVAPPARAFGTLAFDPKGDRVVLYGGVGGGFTSLSDTWQYTVGAGGRWEPIVTDVSPGPMGAPLSVWDPSNDRLVLIGRPSDSGPIETWLLEIAGTPSWTRVTPAGTPPSPRWGQAMVLDPVRHTLVLFGGVEEHRLFDEVWELSLGATPAWRQVAPTGTPPSARGGAAAIYDARRDRMIVFGGVDPALDGVWALTLGETPRWTRIAAAGSPGFMNFAGAVYDSAEDRVVVSVGNSAGVEIWALSLSGAPAWQRLQPLDVPPLARGLAPTAWDSRRQRLVLYGGQLLGEHGMFTDLWALDWERDRTTAIAVQLVQAHAGAGQVRLEWHAPGLTEATVERRGEEPSWVALGSAERGGRDSWSFVDRDLEPGARYGYRLRYRDEGMERTSGEAWVEIPLQARFGLESVSPNPASAFVQVRLALGTHQPATLEIVDVHGRRVLGGVARVEGAGLHETRLTLGSAVRPGIYWVRVAQGGRVDARRISIVR